MYGDQLQVAHVERQALLDIRDYIIAAVLEPRFKLLWCLNEDEKKRTKSLLNVKVASIAEEQVLSTPAITEAYSGTEPLKKVTPDF